MNETDKYGIELEANTSKFTKGLDKAVETSKKAGEQIEKNISGINLKGIGEKLSNSVKNAISKISEKNEMRKFNERIEKAFPETKKDVQELNTEMQQTKGFDFNNMSLKELEKELEKVEKRLETLKNRQYKIDLKLEPYNQALEEIGKDFNREMQEAINNTQREWAQESNEFMMNELARQYTPELSAKDQMMEETEELTQKQEALKQAISQTSKETEKYNATMKNSGNGAMIFGNSINKLKVSFGSAMGNLRRFALSLFGIQSIWRMMSRASSEMLSTNEALTSKLTVTWNGLGQMLLPLLEKIINRFQYIVIFIAKAIQYLTGFNGLAKTTTKNIKNASGAAKSLAKSLGGFDELTNLETGSGTGLASGLANDLKALDDFKEKIKEVEAWMEKTGWKKFFEDIGKLVKDFWQNILKPFWDNLLYPMIKYLVEHPKVFATVFGIFMGSKLGLSIAGIIGSEKALTGLMGLKAALMGIVGIELIVLADELYELYLKVKDYEKKIEDMTHSTEKGKKAWDAFKKALTGGQVPTEKQAVSVSLLTKRLGENSTEIKQGIKLYKELPTTVKIWENYIKRSKGTLNEETEILKENSAEIISNSDALLKMYKNGQLTTEESKKYKSALQENIKSLQKSQEEIIKTYGQGAKQTERYKLVTKALQELQGDLKTYNELEKTSKENIDKKTTSLKNAETGVKNYCTEAEKGQSKVEVLSNSIKNIGEKAQNAKTFIGELSEKWKGISFGEKTLKIKTAFETIVSGITNLASNIANALKNGFASASKNLGLDKLFSKINSFDVGTNYVPNDQLAIVHKGEAIVPKEFNKSEFFNNANNEDVIKAIHDLQRTLEEKDMNAYISKRDVGQASVDYINSQNRLMGRSVV